MCAGEKNVRMIVDAALAAVLLGVMATPLAEDVAHEYLGIATVALFQQGERIRHDW